MPRTNPRTPIDHATPATVLPARALGLALAVLLIGVALTPAAAADTSSKRLCIGDTEHSTSPLEAGPGCANGWIETRTKTCTTKDDGLRDCVIEGRLGVTVDGFKTCGSSENPLHPDPALICVSVTHVIPNEASNQTAWADLKTVPDVPLGGTTVEFTAETCVWADHSDNVGGEYCETYPHEHEIEPADGASSLQILDGTVDYAKTTANNAYVPVGVQP